MMEFPGSLIIIFMFVGVIVAILLVLSCILFVCGWLFKFRILKWFAMIPIVGGVSIVSALSIFLCIIIFCMCFYFISPALVFRTHFDRSPPKGLYHLKGYELDLGSGPDIYLAFQADSTALHQILKNRSREISSYEFSSTLNDSINFSGHPVFWDPYHKSNPIKFYAYTAYLNDSTYPEGTLSYDTSSHWVYYHWSMREY